MNFDISTTVAQNWQNWQKWQNCRIVLLNLQILAARCYASAAYGIMWCLSVCVCVCHVRAFYQNESTPSGSQAILVFPYQTAWQYSDGNLPDGGVESRWGRQKWRFWAYIWLYCPAGPAASYWQHLACCNRCCQYDATEPPYARNLWHLSLVVSGSVDSRRDEEMFMTRSLNITPKTTEQRI